MAEIVSNDNATFYEHLYSTNVFNKPKVITDREAVSTLLVRLILLEPGTNPNRPEMGVGLVSRFRYMEEDNIYELSRAISKQVEAYLPQLEQVRVQCSMEAGHILNIEIEADDVMFKFDAEMNDDGTISMSEFIAAGNQ